jgi:two-component system alkaline phosphatase synthesis response regulator PhoP
MKILIVEDEKPISDLIKMSLEDAGYTCECVYDGMQAADMLEERHYDLILLDVMLPKLDGYELMEYIRPLDIPVIFITAKGAVQDKVKGLKLGAEDYLVKPFEVMELLARVETVLRRYHKSERMISSFDVEIDTQSREVKKNGVPVNLTIKEYELLLLFVRNPNVALFRETLYERVWEGEYMGDSRTVDLHVQRLRKKLGWEERIKAIYKVGYRLEGKV